LLRQPIVLELSGIVVVSILRMAIPDVEILGEGSLRDAAGVGGKWCSHRPLLKNQFLVGREW